MPFRKPKRQDDGPAGPERQPTIFVAHPSDFLTDHMPNGDGLIAFGFINELAARGYRLHVATHGVSLRQPLPPKVTFYEIPRKFGSGWLGRVEYMVRVRLRLRKLLRSGENIDVIHQMNPVSTGLSLSLHGLGRPIVLGTFVAKWPDEHDVGSLRFPLGRIFHSAVKKVVSFVQQQQAAALLVTTPVALNRIAAPGLWENKTFVIRHGVDAELFSPEPTRHPGAARKGPPNVLFYSQVDKRKGIFVLLDAFQQVVKRIPTCKLTIAGRGDDLNRVRSKVAEMDCKSQVHIVGPIERNRAPRLLQDHDVYCLPSLGEPYATTILEAMSCGKPIVATNAGGLPYMIPEAGGFLVPPNDANALAEALIEVLQSADLRAAMGAANRRHVEECHRWVKVVNDLEDVYKRLASRDSKRALEPGTGRPMGESPRKPSRRLANHRWIGEP